MDDPKKIAGTENFDQESLDKFVEVFYPKGVKKVFRYFRHIYRYWKYTFHNLKSWLPIIWKDRDWDYCFLQDMMVHKLKSMRDFYQKGDNVWCEGADQIANEINEVIEIFERIEEDNYEELIDSHFNDWMKKGEPFFIDKTDENGKTYHTLNLPEETEKEAGYRRQVYEKAEEMRKADYEKAYGLIAKNIRKWWD